MTPETDVNATPRHHPPDEGLVEYATGASADGGALAYACHVSLCADCSSRLAGLEAVGGALLDAGPVEPVPSDALDRALAALGVPGAGEDEEPARPPGVPSFLTPYHLPGPLARALGALPRAPRWRYAAPGVRMIDLDRGPTGTTRIRLVAFKPGVTIPPHDHGGTEHIVVFTGAIEEETQRFARGDLATREPGERHEQRIAAGEPCIALVVNEGPLVPLTLRGRLLLALARD